MNFKGVRCSTRTVVPAESRSFFVVQKAVGMSQESTGKLDRALGNLYLPRSGREIKSQASYLWTFPIVHCWLSDQPSLTQLLSWDLP